jgi:hypothetical protein
MTFDRIRIEPRAFYQALPAFATGTGTAIAPRGSNG